VHSRRWAALPSEHELLGYAVVSFCHGKGLELCKNKSGVGVPEVAFILGRVDGGGMCVLGLLAVGFEPRSVCVLRIVISLYFKQLVHDY